MSKHTDVQQTGYNVTITGRHMMITEAMKQHAMEKLSKLDRIASRIIDVHVLMDIQKLEHRIDIIIRFNHIKIKVHACSEDMYTSIDRAVDKLQSQIRRYKERLHTHQAKMPSIIDMNVDVISVPSLDELNQDIDTLNRQELVKRYEPHAVVRQEVRPLKTLTQEEAVMKMELSQDTFLVYRHEVDQKLKVIYRREDGNYGIIAPER